MDQSRTKYSTSISLRKRRKSKEMEEKRFKKLYEKTSKYWKLWISRLKEFSQSPEINGGRRAGRHQHITSWHFKIPRIQRRSWKWSDKNNRSYSKDDNQWSSPLKILKKKEVQPRILSQPSYPSTVNVG